MSPKEGIPEAVGPHVEVHPHGEVLLPEPPIGQMSAETLSHATAEELTELLVSRGVTVDALLTPLGQESYDRNKGTTRWPREDRLRLLLLYLDGKSVAETTKVINQARHLRGESVEVQENTVTTNASNWLSMEAKELSKAAHWYRKWHALMSPVSAETEDELKKLEAVFGMPRHRIFYIPDENRKGTYDDRLPNPALVKGKVTLMSTPVIVHLIYLKFCEHASTKEIEEAAAELLGQPTSYKQKIGPHLSRTLTEQARKAVGMTQGRKPSKPTS